MTGMTQDLTVVQEVKDTMEKTSHSEVEAFLKCERSHYYSYGLAGGLRGKKESDNLVHPFKIIREGHKRFR